MKKAAPEQPPQGAIAAPMRVLREAIVAVPEMRYALAGAGVAAAVALTRLFVGSDIRESILLLGAMLFLMVLIVVFARLVHLDRSTLRYPAILLLWTPVALLSAVGVLSVSCFFIGVPLDWRPGKTPTRVDARDSASHVGPDQTAAVARPADDGPQRAHTNPGEGVRQVLNIGETAAKGGSSIQVGNVSGGTQHLDQTIETKRLTATGKSTVEIGVVRK